MVRVPSSRKERKPKTAMGGRGAGEEQMEEKEKRGDGRKQGEETQQTGQGKEREKKEGTRKKVGEVWGTAEMAGSLHPV